MPFIFTKTEIENLIIVEPAVFIDDRGRFLESFKKPDFVENGIDADFVQDNHSVSKAGVIRGLHFQKAPAAQGKLVRVVRGKAYDVAVDLRPDSATYKKWFGIELSEHNHKMLYVPAGFAHGFAALEDDTVFLYKCTGYYSKEHDAGIRWDDPEIGVNWPVGDPLISEKDKELPLLSEIPQLVW